MFRNGPSSSGLFEGTCHGHFVRRVFREPSDVNIREDKGYTYGIGAGIVSYPETGILTVSTEAANEYVDSIITEVYREMDKLCNDLVPQEELEMVKNYMLGDLCRSYEDLFLCLMHGFI